MTKHLQILIAEDNANDADLLLRALRQSGFEPCWKRVDTETEFIDSLHAGLDIVISDYRMPQFSGIRALELLKRSGLDVPFIIVSGTIGEETAVTAMKLGAADYLLKDRLARLGQAVEHALAECYLRREQRQADQRLYYLAHYDVLTGLPNRTLFYETLSKTLTQATKEKWSLAVLFIDLDHFKNINDSLGHAIGDELLIEFGNRLVQCIRTRDIVGRLGGDEFAVILVAEEGNQDAPRIANKIRNALREPFFLQDHEVTLTASVGIAVYPDDAADMETLIKYADIAMFQAKQAGRDSYRFFTAQMNIEIHTRLDLEIALRKAIDKSEFVLYFQPKVELKSGKISGLEALIRWERPGHGLVPPADFIPLLEETGLIVNVGNWVISSVCEQIRLWLDSSIGPIQVAVNVSSRQFIEGNLEEVINSAIGKSSIPPHLLELELTEGSLMVSAEQTIVSLENFKELGLSISIDDFGTGYSSLAYLRKFPIDKLKIDIAFIRNITNNEEDAAIVLAIIRMAHTLNIEVIAEGVETAAQLAYLQQHSCDNIQGYYFSRPLPTGAIEQILLEDRRLLIT